MEINLVSSVGDAERATEHTCTTGEVTHWKPKLKRQVASGESELSPMVSAVICVVYLVKSGKEYLGF